MLHPGERHGLVAHQQNVTALPLLRGLQKPKGLEGVTGSTAQGGLWCHGLHSCHPGS